PGRRVKRRLQLPIYAGDVAVERLHHSKNKLPDVPHLRTGHKREHIARRSIDTGVTQAPHSGPEIGPLRDAV
ncbi:MAG: hypothetical protein M3Z14_02350, partial [Candidatus Eremiobacteraeota bacterium]|nr:hypothetical protein [Candidatus Eremiobacteraeota bacterium]